MRSTQKSIIAAFTILLIAGLYHYVFSGMPTYERENILAIPQSSIIQDREGNELFRFFEEDRRRVSYEDISPHMINAIVAIEDKSFRENSGIDSTAIARAATNNMANHFGYDNPLQ
jgi:penicillin-binding protein 1A